MSIRRLHLAFKLAPVFLTGVFVTRSAAARTINVGASCSLSQAVTAANTNATVGGCLAGDDTTSISVTSGIDSGSIMGDVVQLESGTRTYTIGDPGLEIWSNIEIRGTSMGSTTISFATNAGPSTQGQQHGLSIWNCNGNAAGIYVNATFKASNVTLRQSTGGFTSGICAQWGLLQLMAARVTGFGIGGIVARSLATSENDDANPLGVYVVNSWLDNNHSPGNGGGIHVYGYETQLNVFGTSVVNNSSDGGGGGIFDGHIGAGEIARIDFSTVSGNNATGDGGGILEYLDTPGNLSYLLVSNSTVANNHATGYGGGLYQTAACADPDGSGGISSELTMQTSIINNNHADSAAVVDSTTSPPITEEDNLNLKPLCSTDPPIAAGSNRGCNNSMVYVPGNDWSVANQAPSATTGASCWTTIRDAGLSPLSGQGANGLPMHVPLSSSAAVDLVAGLTGPDQRGVAVPQFGRTDATLADLGAVELVSRMETENMSVAQKSSDTHVVVTGASYSGGKGTNLQADAANDFVTYQTPSSVLPGTYNVVVGFKKGSSGGVFQFSAAETVGGSYTNVGGTQNTFASSSSWVSVNLGSITFGTTSSKFLKFKVTGGSAGSFQLFPDYLTLTKQ